MQPDIPCYSPSSSFHPTSTPTSTPTPTPTPSFVGSSPFVPPSPPPSLSSSLSSLMIVFVIFIFGLFFIGLLYWIKRSNILNSVLVIDGELGELEEYEEDEEYEEYEEDEEDEEDEGDEEEWRRMKKRKIFEKGICLFKLNMNIFLVSLQKKDRLRIWKIKKLKYFFIFEKLH